MSVLTGLAQAAVHVLKSSALLPPDMFDPSIMQSSFAAGTDVFSIASRILAEPKFNLTAPFDEVLSKFGDDIRAYAAEWAVDGANPTEVAKKVKELTFLNVMIYAVGGWRAKDSYFEAEFTL